MGGCSPAARACATVARDWRATRRINGWGRSAVSAMAARRLRQLISGRNSSSAATLVHRKRSRSSAPTPRSCARLSAAFTPANGPAASPRTSRSTDNPCAWASAAVCVPGRALTATVRQPRCNRRVAHNSSGVPASNATAFSPPKRTDRPPAITTPTTGHARGSCWVARTRWRCGAAPRQLTAAHETRRQSIPGKESAGMTFGKG